MASTGKADVCEKVTNLNLAQVFGGMLGAASFTASYRPTHNITTLGLIGFSSLAFVLCAEVLLCSRGCAYRCGKVMNDRVVNVIDNWQTHTLRSLMETAAWLHIIFVTFQMTEHPGLSILLGTVSSIFMVLTGELAKKEIGKVEEVIINPKHEDTTALAIVSFSSISLCVSALALSALTHSRDLPDVLVASLLATANGIVLILSAQALASCSSTHSAGNILLDRVVGFSHNWVEHQVRSAVEMTFHLSVTFAVYAKTENLQLGVLSGVLGGIAVVCVSELITVNHKPKVTSATVQRGSRSTVITWEEVLRHNTPEDAWLVIDSLVYDVTSFAPRHPGGHVITMYAGCDATDQFHSFHRPKVNIRLRPMLVGTLAPSTTTTSTTTASSTSTPTPLPATRDYRALRARLWEEGYFECDSSFVASKQMVVAGFGVGVLVGTLCVGGWPGVLISAVSCGMMIHQSAFLAHDALHYCMGPRESDFNLQGWVYGSLLFGISCSKWTEEHSIHHAMTKRPLQDPQFSYLPLFCVSLRESQMWADACNLKLKQTDRFKSWAKARVPEWICRVASCGERLAVRAQCGLASVVVPLQHFTFLPIAVLVGRFFLFLESLMFALKVGSVMDVVGMGLFLTWYGRLAMCFPLVNQRIVFVVLSTWVIGILHIQLLLSHLATEAFTKEEEDKIEFFELQMRTTRNIDTKPWNAWFHGGLEYQIEHHLFPQLPRHNLVKVAPMVKELCKKHNIPYLTTNFTNTIALCVNDLGELASAFSKLEFDH